MQFSGMLYHVALVRAISEECQFLQGPHDATSQKTAFFITTMKISNLALDYTVTDHVFVPALMLFLHITNIHSITSSIILHNCIYIYIYKAWSQSMKTKTMILCMWEVNPLQEGSLYQSLNHLLKMDINIRSNALCSIVTM
jgi:hypothetical protein